MALRGVAILAMKRNLQKFSLSNTKTEQKLQQAKRNWNHFKLHFIYILFIHGVFYVGKVPFYSAFAKFDSAKDKEKRVKFMSQANNLSSY